MIYKGFVGKNKVELKRAWRKVRSEKKQVLNLKLAIAKTSRLKRSEQRFFNYDGGLKRYNLLRWRIKSHLPFSKKVIYLIKVPKVLCYIDNPEDTHKFINHIELELERKRPWRININHEGCEKIGLAAGHTFDEVILRYKNSIIKNGFKGEITGKLREGNWEVNNFLWDSGIMNRLNIQENEVQNKDKFIEPEYQNQIFSHHFRYSDSKDKRTHELRNPELSSTATNKLIEHFNKCFRQNGYSLTDDGYQMLSSAFGEIIDNCREHGHQQKENWSVYGYYEKRTRLCRFAVVNEGQSIFESLSGENSEARDDILSIFQTNSKNSKWLDIVKKKRTKIAEDEVLWTVLALQEGISSKRKETGKRSTRGKGLMDMIDFINLVGESKDSTKISIISGRTRILIDGKYQISHKQINENDYRQIIFNDEQDFMKPMAKSNASTLISKYKGTIITAEFVIKENLRSKPKKTGSK